MQIAQIDQTPIDVAGALKGTSYEEVAEKLVKEFHKARIEVKGMVHNSPLRLKTTFGVDVYEVMRLILAYEGPPKTPSKKIKKESS